MVCNTLTCFRVTTEIHRDVMNLWNLLELGIKVYLVIYFFPYKLHNTHRFYDKCLFQCPFQLFVCASEGTTFSCALSREYFCDITKGEWHSLENISIWSPGSKCNYKSAQFSLCVFIFFQQLLHDLWKKIFLFNWHASSVSLIIYPSSTCTHHIRTHQSF